MLETGGRGGVWLRLGVEVGGKVRVRVGVGNRVLGYT